jgi:hypothetical protein
VIVGVFALVLYLVFHRADLNLSQYSRVPSLPTTTAIPQQLQYQCAIWMVQHNMDAGVCESITVKY